jgi:hypothetical protein
MERLIAVERLPDNWVQTAYHLAVGAVGYESRSRHLFETLEITSHLNVAAAFDTQNVLAFDSNLRWFQSRGFSIESISDSAYEEWFSGMLRKAVLDDDDMHVIFDISSLSRTRIAQALSVARRFNGHQKLTIDFLYCLAEFTPPPTSQSANSHVGPVTNEFAGWWSEPERSLSAVVGLGYEQDKALGAVEYLEAKEVWIFQPQSVIEAYTFELESANQTLLSMTDANHRFVYRVQDPLDCYSKMLSLVQGLLATSNVVLLPFGPKIVVLCSLIIAATDQRIAVWRVSAQEAEEPVDRKGSSNFYGLRVTFPPKLSSITRPS